MRLEKKIQAAFVGWCVLIVAGGWLVKDVFEFAYDSSGVEGSIWWGVTIISFPLWVGHELIARFAGIGDIAELALTHVIGLGVIYLFYLFVTRMVEH